MGLYLKRNDTRSELQERLAAELQEKQKKKLDIDPEKSRMDGVEDMRFVKGTKQTTSLAWVWMLIGLAVVVLTVWIIILYNSSAA